MPKQKPDNVEKITKMIRRNNQMFFINIASVFLVLLIGFCFFVLFHNLRMYSGDKEMLKIIGGDRDSGGCLTSAGYSWCEIKERCLRVWEEPCVAEKKEKELSKEEKMTNFLKENLIFFAPEKDNNQDFNLSEINFISDQAAFIGYDDGNNFYNAEVVFRISSAGEILIEKFIIKNKNGEEYKLQSCESDLDCLPLPSECHSRVCINKKYFNQFERPEICTTMFDPQAAYLATDCACDLENNECFNKNLTR